MNVHMKKSNVKKELQNAKSLQDCADKFGVVGDLTRLKICWLLCNYPEMSVGEISEFLKIEQSTVSHALRKLNESGVVTSRKESKFKFYSMVDSSLSSFIKETIL